MSEAATEGRRRSRGAGGGAARRAERTAVKIEAAKYIERNIPTMDILSEEALQHCRREAPLSQGGAAVGGAVHPGAGVAG